MAKESEREKERKKKKKRCGLGEGGKDWDERSIVRIISPFLSWQSGMPGG